MAYLTTAVVLVGLLGLVNLIVAAAIMARLREHSQKLVDLDMGPQALILGAGQSVAEFTARTTRDRVLTRADLAEDTLVAFFSPGCPSCVEQAPDFIARTADRPSGKVIAVVVADPNQPTESLVRDLEKTAEVVLEEHGGAMVTAFRVKGLPTMCLIGARGTVTASGGNLDELLGTGSAREMVRVKAAA